MIMRLHRFYVEKELSVGAEIMIDETSQLHQWLSVFRCSTGDKVILFNGSGNEYEAEFVELHKKKALLAIGSESTAIMPKHELHLCLALIKKDLFELVVEKCTELGISSITPIITERTQNKNINRDRLRKIAIEASEQSGRGDVPRINESVSLMKALDAASGYTIYVADVNHKGVQEKIKKSSNYPQALFIGPEGGWGEKDLTLFAQYTLNTLNLGETTLRAETAAIVGSFILLK